ncbi:hypothetical protein HZI73_11840 [Vallitalea pronyensis]|uniref:Sporulation integral membrane protein YlbJ n=1 Tax=Vallitalea pronyensis TaxID=1348613 RepID=A0A8J8MKF5_9FIRM|nr:hypothetical protein [Vallitalea pronyensis]QUI22938.1 hypothetical protein HZI73_11840 [Vallitalea pronyensis]
MKRKITKNFMINLLLILLLCLVLLMPKSSMKAAEEGLLLWFNVMIPTLFPFILLSNLIINSNIIYYINIFLTPIMRRIFGLPGVAGYAFVTGLLSGFPVGAKITADLLKKGAVTLPQAQYMLTFCNNASPMFIIGFIATGLFGRAAIGILMLMVIYTANIITACIYRIVYAKALSHNHHEGSAKHTSRKITFSIFDESIMNAITLIVKIGGYIIFFSIIMNCLKLIPIQGHILKDFTFGLMELANGTKLLVSASATLPVRFVLLSTLVAFGTFSVHAQTASVIHDTDLHIKPYIMAKLINAVITFITAFLFIPLL